MSDKPWYQDGLRFTCTQCGNCCTGAPGFVWVNAEEIEQIAAYLNTPADALKAEHVRAVGNRTSLNEFKNGDCTFLDPQTRGCRIYPVRPRQCRTWPFWDSNIKTPESWRGVQDACPGAGQGTLYTIEHIEKQAAVIKL
jgi:uncharacterized protein